MDFGESRLEILRIDRQGSYIIAKWWSIYLLGGGHLRVGVSRVCSL